MLGKVSALWVSPFSSVALAVPAIFDRGRLVFGLRTLCCLWFGVIQKPLHAPHGIWLSFNRPIYRCSGFQFWFNLQFNFSSYWLLQCAEHWVILVSFGLALLVDFPDIAPRLGLLHHTT